MHAILTRPTTPANNEPELQHDPGRTLQSGLYEDMEREDDARGYEREPEQRALSALLLADVRRGDRIAAAGSVR